MMPRYTLDLNDDYDKLIKAISTDELITKSEVIRRAILHYAFIKRELKKNKGIGELKLSITETESDTIVKDIVII